MPIGKDYRLATHDCGDCSIAVYSRDLEAQDEDCVDPNLFDAGYTLAASTGLAKVRTSTHTATAVQALRRLRAASLGVHWRMGALAGLARRCCLASVRASL